MDDDSQGKFYLGKRRKEKFPKDFSSRPSCHYECHSTTWATRSTPKDLEDFFTGFCSRQSLVSMFGLVLSPWKSQESLPSKQRLLCYAPGLKIVNSSTISCTHRKESNRTEAISFNYYKYAFVKRVKSVLFMETVMLSSSFWCETDIQVSYQSDSCY